jgi:hypothetical protein
MRICVALVMLLANCMAVADESVVAPRLLKSESLSTPFEQSVLQRQFDALSAMQLDSLKYSPHGPVRLLGGDTGLVLPSNVRGLKKGDLAPQVLLVFKDLFLAEGNETLIVRSHAIAEGAEPVLHLSESIRGIPVFGGGLAAGYDAATFRVSGMSAHFVPDRGLPRKPALSARQAEQRVAEALHAAEETRGVEVTIRDGTHLAYFADWVHDGPAALVWVVTALGTTEFLVDASTGAIVHRHSDVIPNRAEVHQ